MCLRGRRLASLRFMGGYDRRLPIGVGRRQGIFLIMLFFRLLAEETAEHAAGFFLQAVDDVALQAVEVHVFEEAVGV